MTDRSAISKELATVRILVFNLGLAIAMPLLKMVDMKKRFKGVKRTAAAKKQTASIKTAVAGSRPSSAYEIVGTTSDGVKVLRSKTNPTHFTPNEIRTTIRDFRNQRKHG